MVDILTTIVPEKEKVLMFKRITTNKDKIKELWHGWKLIENMAGASNVDSSISAVQTYVQKCHVMYKLYVSVTLIMYKIVEDYPYMYVIVLQTITL